MGNSISVDQEKPDIWWPPPHTHTTETEQTEQMEQTTLTKVCASTQTEEIQPTYTENATSSEDNDDRIVHRAQNELKLKQFKSELEKKHAARREAIAERSREILFLREELMKYKKENEQLKELIKNNESTTTSDQDFEEVKSELQWLRNENEELQNKISQLNEDLNRSDELLRQNQDLRKSIAETQRDLQAVNTQVLEFEKERHDYESHVVALKDVITVSKRLLEIRENQLRELKEKVNDIETSLAEREVSMMSQNLKNEYERQIVNIRNLRALYEQRQAATKAERDLMASELTDAKNILESEQKKNGEMQERIDELENNVSDKYDEIKSLESQLGLAKAEFRGLEAEMSVINQLFSQILYGFNNCQEIDFDKLSKLLEENHDLLTNIVTKEDSDSMSYAMPKVLLDLVNQANEESKSTNADIETETSTSDSCSGSNSVPVAEENQQPELQTCNTINSAEEIVTKLPKVWRVLTELLRQQSGQLPVTIEEDGTDPCYKSIETPKGPKLVLSVSQTFIRLKDLILEKKSVEKEMTRLKQLNTHLEVRLQDQEKRLETVSTELSKTWHVVGRMQRQHQQLHTHEKILRYELAQKRKMLTELKEELEYCREKWKQARVKNSNTEEEWKKLRTEFASRKTVVADELNNSGESGYSDERECSSDEEYNTDKRNKKLINKTIVNEQTSDTDTEETNTTKTDNTDVEINNLENIILKKNQGQEDNTQSTELLASSSESTSQQTDFEVKNQREKTVPASLDMIDNVCALGTIPVAISHILEEAQTTNLDDTSTTNCEETTTNCEEREKTVLASLDMIDNVCALGTIPVPISHILEETQTTNLDDTSTTNCEETPTTNCDEREKTVPASLDMIDNVCALGTIPVPISHILEETQTTNLDDTSTTNCEEAPTTNCEEREKTVPASLDMIDNVCALGTIPVAISHILEETQTTNSNDTSTTNCVETPTTNYEERTATLDVTPSTSSSSTTPTEREINQDERLRKREERLKRLEEQCQQLVTKVTNTNNRSTDISNRLETLHEQYGSDHARTNGQEPENNSE